MEFRVTPSLTEAEIKQWDRFVVESPFGHSFQHYQWGRFQKDYTGREVLYLIGTEEGKWRVVAQIFERLWPAPFASLVNYEISCGPVFLDPEDFDETLRYLDRWAAPRAVQLQVGPRWPIEQYAPFAESARTLGFKASDDPRAPIYDEETAFVDLRPPENDILMSFRYTTRYEIRKAEKAGVAVRFSSDREAMQIFYDLHLQQRTRLRIAPERQRFFMLLQERFLYDPANGIIAIAEYKGRPLSAALYIRHGKICRYRHGAANESLRKEADTSHLLHWRAMEYFKKEGCEWYDFCGASPVLPPDYPTYGTNIFKTGFSKHFVRYTPDFTKTYRPLLSWAFDARAWLMDATYRLVGRLRLFLHRGRGR
jgi:lipid II:glycine glycyltransferase (peptidoglycan interpeptide bridge formation enzyme)